MVPNLVDTVESAHTIGRTTSRGSRVEVLPRSEGRRSWTAEQKLAIVGESVGPDLTPTEVAASTGSARARSTRGASKFPAYEGSAISRTTPRFTAVELTPAYVSHHSSPAEPPPCLPPVASPRPEGLVEVMLPGGVSVQVEAHVDARALRRVLGALEGR